MPHRRSRELWLQIRMTGLVIGRGCKKRSGGGEGVSRLGVEPR